MQRLGVILSFLVVSAFAKETNAFEVEINPRVRAGSCYHVLSEVVSQFYEGPGKLVVEPVDIFGSSERLGALYRKMGPNFADPRSLVAAVEQLRSRYESTPIEIRRLFPFVFEVLDYWFVPRGNSEAVVLFPYGNIRSNRFENDIHIYRLPLGAIALLPDPRADPKLADKFKEVRVAGECDRIPGRGLRANAVLISPLFSLEANSENVSNYLACSAHETRHHLDALLLQTWLAVNTEILRSGGIPDFLFRKYAVQPDGSIQLAEGFFVLYLEIMARIAEYEVYFNSLPPSEFGDGVNPYKLGRLYGWYEPSWAEIAKNFIEGAKTGSTATPSVWYLMQDGIQFAENQKPIRVRSHNFFDIGIKIRMQLENTILYTTRAADFFRE